MCSACLCNSRHLKQHYDFFFKKENLHRAVTQPAMCLPSVHEALSLIPRITKKWV